MCLTEAAVNLKVPLTAIRYQNINCILFYFSPRTLPRGDTGQSRRILFIVRNNLEPKKKGTFGVGTSV